MKEKVRIHTIVERTMSMVPFEHSWDCLRITTGEFRFPQNNDYYGNTISPQA